LAGLFYLAITVPLTHLVNWVDRRLRQGRVNGPDEEPGALAGETPLPVPAEGVPRAAA
jgi:polar amino acid transport system permease protein/polar amino acid transport system substrate-binding protein